MPFYSINPKAWAGRPARPADTGANPYDPGSNRFADRNRQTETDLSGGLVRVDMGEPIKSLPSEGLRPKPVKGPGESPPPSPLPAEEPPALPPTRPVPPPRSRKEPWGLNRDEI